MTVTKVSAWDPRVPAAPASAAGEQGTGAQEGALVPEGAACAFFAPLVAGVAPAPKD